MNVLSKSVFCMVFLLLIVVALLFMLSFFKFQSILTSLIEKRLAVTRHALHESIEDVLELGLGLDEIQNVEKIILATQKNNPDIVAIEIFGVNGRTLYSTDNKRVQQFVDTQRLDNLRTGLEHDVQVELDAAFLCVFPLLNHHRQVAGGGLLLYSKGNYYHQVLNFKNSLLLKSAMIFIVFAVLAALGIMTACRGLKRYLLSIERSHDQIRKSDKIGQNVCFIDTTGLPAQASASSLMRLDGFDERLCIIERNMANAVKELETLELSGSPPLAIAHKGNAETADDQQTLLASKMARPLILIMMGVLCLASFVFAYFSFIEFSRFLTPELSKKNQLIANNINQNLARAIAYGIPFEEVVGVDSYLDAIVAEITEVTHLIIQNIAGQTLFQSAHANSRVSDINQAKLSTEAGNSLATERAPPESINHRYPFQIDGKNIGTIYIGIAKNFVGLQLNGIIYDNIVIFIVAVLVAFHMMTALFRYYVTGPIERLNMLIDLQVTGNFSKYIQPRGGGSIGKIAEYLSLRAKRLNAYFIARRNQLKTRADRKNESTSDGALRRVDAIGRHYGLSIAHPPSPLVRANISDMRISLFLFAFAEELQKSFLPIFVRQLYQPNQWLNESVLISLPIVMWLAIVGLAAPFSGKWSRRFGYRNIFMAGLIPSSLGFVGCSMATTIYEVVLWRGASALGYAMITIACQEYLLGKHVSGRRNVNLAVFVGIVISATVSGTAIGGILAARVGYQATFLIAAGLMVFAGFAGYHMLSRHVETGIEIEAKPASGMGAVRMILKNHRFLVFLAFIAVPTNILMAAYLWYLVPLYLFDLGATTAEIGRTMMVYYLLIIAIGETASKRTKTTDDLILLVGMGSLLSGVGLIAFHQWHSLWAVVFTVTLLGIAHALIKAPQIALSLEICSAEIRKAGHNVVLSFLRMLERFGAILGLIIGAAMIEHYGYQKTTEIAGIGVCTASLIFSVFFFLTRKNTRQS